MASWEKTIPTSKRSKILVQRIIKDRRLKIITKGFGGCGDMLNKGKMRINFHEKLGM